MRRSWLGLLLMTGLTIGSLLPEGYGPVHAVEQVVTLEAQGAASGGRSQTLESIERAALADAKRMALEQAGTALSSATTVENHVLSSDEIRTFAEGVVKVLAVRDKQVKFDEASQTFLVTLSIKAEVQALEAQELLKRLQQTRQAESGQSAPLDFGFSLIAWQPVVGQARGVRIKPASTTAYSRMELREGGELPSGAEFQIHVTPRQDAWFYLLNVDARGLLYPLLPNPEGRSDHFLKAGQTYVLPGLNQFYQLDQATGTERIYLLAANERQQDIDYLVRRSLQQPDGIELAGLLAASMSLRQSARVEQGQEQQYQVSDQVTVPLIEELVRGKAHAVRVFSFEHR